MVLLTRYYRTVNNALTSPLLRLPAEIRLQIFELVFGGNTLHMEEYRRSVKATVCKAKVSEDEAYENFKRAAQRPMIPFGYGQRSLVDKNGRNTWLTTSFFCAEYRHYFVESWTSRHDECRGYVSRQGHGVDLRSLRTCRMIYQEMRDLPYSANTFCFEDTEMLVNFANVSPRGFESLQHLSLGVHVPGMWNPELSNHTSRKAWARMNLAGGIKNLKTIHLAVEYNCGMNSTAPNLTKPSLAESLDLCSFYRDDSSDAECRHQNLCYQVAHLSHGIPEFKVTVCDDPRSFYSPHESSGWSGQVMREYLESQARKVPTVQEKWQIAVAMEAELRFSAGREA